MNTVTVEPVNLSQHLLSSGDYSALACEWPLIGFEVGTPLGFMLVETSIHFKPHEWTKLAIGSGYSYKLADRPHRVMVTQQGQYTRFEQMAMGANGPCAHNMIVLTSIAKAAFDSACTLAIEWNRAKTVYAMSCLAQVVIPYSNDTFLASLQSDAHRNIESRILARNAFVRIEQGYGLAGLRQFTTALHDAMAANLVGRHLTAITDGVIDKLVDEVVMSSIIDTACANSSVLGPAKNYPVTHEWDSFPTAANLFDFTQDHVPEESRINLVGLC